LKLVTVFLLAFLGACSHDLDNIERPSDAVVKDQGADQGGPDLPGADSKVKPDLATVDAKVTPDMAKVDLPAPDAKVATPDAKVPTPDLAPKPDLAPPDMSTCGNLSKEPYEACDHSVPLTNDDCSNYVGSTLGKVTCTKQCKIDTSGCYKILGGGEFQLTYSGGAYFAAAAANSKMALTAFIDYTAPTWDIKASRFTTKVIDDKKAVPVASGVSGASTATIDVASNGTGFLVVWLEKASGIRGVLLNSNGMLDTGAKPFSICANTYNTKASSYPRVTSDGSGYFVVWGDNRTVPKETGNPIRIFGARVDSKGIVLDCNKDVPILVSHDHSAYHGVGYPDVAFAGGNYLVVWHVHVQKKVTEKNIAGVRVSKAGKVLDAKDIPLTSVMGDQRYPVVAGAASQFLVAWEDLSGTKPFLGGTRVQSATGNVLDPKGMTIAAPGAAPWLWPAVASDGKDYLVVYFENKKYGEVFAQRVLKDGKVATASPIKLTNTNNKWESYPSVTLYKGAFFITYRIGSYIHGRRVSF